MIYCMGILQCFTNAIKTIININDTKNAAGVYFPRTVLIYNYLVWGYTREKHPERYESTFVISCFAVRLRQKSMRLKYNSGC